MVNGNGVVSFWDLVKLIIFENPEYALSMAYIFLTGYIIFFFSQNKLRDIAKSEFDDWDKLLWSIVLGITNLFFSLLLVAIVYNFIIVIIPPTVSISLLSDLMFLLLITFIAMLIIPSSVVWLNVSVPGRTQIEIYGKSINFIYLGIFLTVLYITVTQQKFVIDTSKSNVFSLFMLFVLISLIWVGDEIKERKSYEDFSLIHDVYIARIIEQIQKLLKGGRWLIARITHLLPLKK